MGSGVFLAIVVVLWFVVLVPMVLTRRDTAREAALPEPLSPAARILTRRTATARTAAASSRRFAPMSRRESSPSLDHQTDIHPIPVPLADRGEDVVDTGVHARYVDDVDDQPPLDPDAPRPADPSRHERTNAARERMLSRRRRTLTALFALAVVTLVLAVVTAAWVWVPQVLVDLALFGYLYHLRNEAIREAERREMRALRFAPYRHETVSTQRRIFAPVAQQDPAAETDERRHIVRIDDEDPAFYDLGYSSPVAHNVDLRGGADGSVHDAEEYDQYSDGYPSDDYEDGGWDQRKAVGA